MSQFFFCIIDNEAGLFIFDLKKKEEKKNSTYLDTMVNPLDFEHWSSDIDSEWEWESAGIEEVG